MKNSIGINIAGVLWVIASQVAKNNILSVMFGITAIIVFIIGILWQD